MCIRDRSVLPDSARNSNHDPEGCANVYSAINTLVGITSTIVGLGTTGAPTITYPDSKVVWAPRGGDSKNIIYVGMGEHAPRGVMTAHGNGVYKSTDAGKSWVHLGLDKTQHISRIKIHPQNPNILWVAAQGALYGKSEERGIYKSIDGGKSWKKVLYVNNSTGASELSIDKNNPKILYAAMWDHMRTPWKVISGGPGSGLYKSLDGGETWIELSKGLPEEMGKMAIAVSPADSKWVYALIESESKKEKGGLFLSKNGGENWKRISNDHRLIQRAWYYIELTLDPKNKEIVYVLSASAYKSNNSGVDWEEIDTHHGDYHDLWINPDDNSNMLISNDGGCEITFDSGKNWSLSLIHLSEPTRPY